MLDSLKGTDVCNFGEGKEQEHEDTISKGDKDRFRAMIAVVQGTMEYIIFYEI